MSAPGIEVGAGITVGPGISIGANRSLFTLSSTNFTSYNYGDLQNVTNSSFTVPGPNHQFSYCNYNANLGSGNSGDQTYYTNLLATWTGAGLTTSESVNHPYAFNVTWGAGGTPSSTVVFATLSNNGPTAGSLIFGPVYTGNNDWQTPGTSITALYGAIGDYNLPVSFTLISPPIEDIGVWC